MRNIFEKIKCKIKYLRFEFIYLLGGIPKEHINTLNYKNIDSVFENIKANIKKVNDLL